MPRGGQIRIETRNVTLSAEELACSPDALPGDYAKLTVTDEGVGMPPEVVGRAFEPFFTTKDSGRARGLGLSTIYGFVRQSGGHASIYSEAGKGTAVSLYFPRHAGNAAEKPNQVPGRPLQAAAGEIVLVVEDNDQVRELTERRLDGLGYRILSAGNGPDAIALLEERPRN